MIGQRKGQSAKPSAVTQKPVTARKTNGQVSTTAPKRAVVPSSTNRPTQEEVAVRAYQIFEREGRQEGKEKEVENWLRAEAELLAQGRSGTA